MDESHDCLVFWSVLCLDFIVSFGIGRPMTIRPGSITQRLPITSDFGHESSAETYISLCKFVSCMASLADELNNHRNVQMAPQELAKYRNMLVSVHATLPREMLWTSGKYGSLAGMSHNMLITSLRAQQRSRQAANFISLHLWYHAVLLHLDSGALEPNPLSTSAPSTQAQDNAEAIADITAACGVLDPEPYICLPFICQPWFSAGVTLMRGKPNEVRFSS